MSNWVSTKIKRKQEAKTASSVDSNAETIVGNDDCDCDYDKSDWLSKQK